jgi:hypothetical protein
MRKLVTVVLVVAAALVSTGSSASAHGGHRSCGFWGSVIIADVAVKEFTRLAKPSRSSRGRAAWAIL